MSCNVLLTLGRLPKGLELARSLHRAGCRVFIADPFGWHLCKPSASVQRSFRVTAPNASQARYLDDLLAIVANEQIDIVIPVSEEALHVAKLADRLPAGTRLFGPGHEVLARLHDKHAFISTAVSYGLLAPETFASASPQAQQLARRSDYVIKPVHGCSGIGLRLRRAGDPLIQADTAPGQVVQERLYGRHVSSFSLVRDGEVMITAAYEGTVFSGTVATCFRRVEDAPEVAAWIAAFVKQEAYSGFISFDFIMAADGAARAIECNPRLTSGVHFVDPSDLAAAVLDRPLQGIMKFKAARVFQEGHTTLMEAYKAIFRPREFFRRLGAVISARDVLFDWRDPMPFFLMTPMSWDVLRQALFDGRSLGDAATRDIVWTPQALARPVADGEVRGDEPARGM